MPRGRHRHSPPLHKILPPLSVAAAAVVCAGGAWAFADPLVLRGLAAVAGVAAVTGAAFMRGWDREAGRRVADLTRARESDQWKTDERVAELEADVDEARGIRTKLEGKLRAKRVELARLRGEHAALLRRYATAETERASALEGRRRLAIEAAVEPRALAAGGVPTPSAFLMASKALDELAANSARQAALSARSALPAPAARRALGGGARPAAAEDEAEAEAPRPALPARRAATPSAIVPYARRTQHRPEQRSGGGFDFFGAQHGGAQHGGTRHDGTRHEGARDGGREHEEHRAAGDAPEQVRAEPEATEPEVIESAVIDLTEHDDTEQLEVGGLRSALGS
ncbi:coiled-coil domain-containing protein [Streptomyces montanisoli]|uniref:Secreted protein n=1 Tax=Streptomyces montanisoli TaxID=2798581 RepID=A0A940MH85_9ACTN|nr:hypothetical protein [Streptomyces montanisoli]MBP0460010.1 hypothetical protein [Streptomyces montanisoli]